MTTSVFGESVPNSLSLRAVAAVTIHRGRRCLFKHLQPIGPTEAPPAVTDTKHSSVALRTARKSPMTPVLRNSSSFLKCPGWSEFCLTLFSSEFLIRGLVKPGNSGRISRDTKQTGE